MNERIRFGIYQSGANRGSVSMFRWCRVTGWRYGCLWILCVDSRPRYLYIVLGRISAHLVYTKCFVAPYRYLHPTVYLSGRYRKSRLPCMLLSDQDWSRYRLLL